MPEIKSFLEKVLPIIDEMQLAQLKINQIKNNNFQNANADKIKQLEELIAQQEQEIKQIINQ